MPTYEITAPDGKVYEVTGEGTAEEALAHFQKGYKPVGAAQGGRGVPPPTGQVLTQPGASTALSGGAPAGPAGAQAPAIPSDPNLRAPAPITPQERYKHVSGVEEVGGGILHGINRAVSGVKDLVGFGSEDDRRRLEQGAEFVKGTGAGSTVGQIVGETAATAGPARAVGKLLAKGTTTVLPKATKYLAELGGNRIFNLGTAGRAAVEGGTAAAVMAPGEGESRAGNAAFGTAVGGAAPAAIGAVSAPIKAIWNAMAPTAKAATLRAAKAFERTLGISEVEAIEKAVKANQKIPSVLPKTTAAMADNTHLGAMERGARHRNLADFEKHDQTVAKKAWTELGQATSEADTLPMLEGIPDDLMNAGKREFSRLALPNDVRDNLVTQLSRLADNGEALARPEVRRELDNAVRALSHEAAGAEVLPQLVWGMGKEAGRSDTISLAKKIIAEAADTTSGGRFTKLQTEFGEAMDNLKGAQGAAGVRETFMSPGGAPLVRAYGTQATGGATPVVTSQKLSTALASKGEEVMDPNNVQRAAQLADELRRHEIYTPTPGMGVSAPELGPAQGIGVAAINSSPAWSARGIISTIFGSTNKSTKKAIDAALLNPDEFLRTMATKRALNRPLSPTEQKIEALVRAQGRALGASNSGE